MPEKRAPRSLVILRATITLDGKLDADAPLQAVRGPRVDALDPAQARTLLITGGVDEIELTIRQRVDGRRDAATLTGPPTPDFLPHSIALRLLRMESRGEECLLHYRVRRRVRKTSSA